MLVISKTRKKTYWYQIPNYTEGYVRITILVVYLPILRFLEN